MRKHLTYANVMSTLAALFALSGGVAYAANTIASSDIIDGEVRTADLGANAVNSARIADGQVTEADIGQGAVNTAELKNDVVTGQKVREREPERKRCRQQHAQGRRHRRGNAGHRQRGARIRPGGPGQLHRHPGHLHPRTVAGNLERDPGAGRPILRCRARDRLRRRECRGDAGLVQHDRSGGKRVGDDA